MIFGIQEYCSQPTGVVGAKNLLLHQKTNQFHHYFVEQNLLFKSPPQCGILCGPVIAVLSSDVEYCILRCFESENHFVEIFELQTFVHLQALS